MNKNKSFKWEIKKKNLIMKVKIKNALISVSDKENIISLLKSFKNIKSKLSAPEELTDQ